MKLSEIIKVISPGYTIGLSVLFIPLAIAVVLIQDVAAMNTTPTTIIIGSLIGVPIIAFFQSIMISLVIWLGRQVKRAFSR
ncbi:hypothetical protein [Oceanicoccus sp. KOV_DT_Chl]|uniref:hypothetical protein n=1 Tax=Oceanicoccus sp. KOV_DT_Chl TaxID=1904639 RepID=UPI000C7A9EFF|nr:hypothetical protein [Oceanicoccus sp. KOV_DT_Chl]